ncbi:MAG TPA: response regulator [Candidatus Acidoferrales bacterium]|nr:response regulator [Candidatus Acidoferrales bacterium]
MLLEKIAVARPFGVGQAAQVCRVTTRTINNWIRAGKLKAYATPGGHFRIWPSDLKKFLKAHNMDITFDFRGERPKRVLIVDDDEAYAEMVREVLHDKLPNCEIAITQDGYDGLIMLGELKPDLVVLDLMMPGIDGFKVLDLIADRKSSYDLKVLILSGNLTMQSIERLKRSRADRWLAKPISSAELVHSVLDLLSGEELGGKGIS